MKYLIYTAKGEGMKNTQENNVFYTPDNYLYNWNAFFGLFFSKEIPKNKKA